MKSSKGKTAFCFPGQLQERPSLEDHPLREDAHFKELLRRASGQTKFDLLNFSFKGEEKEEDLSLKLQIATYILSLVHFYRLREAGWNPDILAEHSMGIYAALAASEADIIHIDMGQEAAQETTDLRFVIAVRDRQHLAIALRNLQRTQSVVQARRSTD